jgi:glycine cleavage system H protein
MSKVPEELRYTKSHEWVRPGSKGMATIGITDHAQSALGDLVFVELPEEGAELGAGEDCAVVESVKAASDVYSPIAGTVVEINEDLVDAPEILNQDPYDTGWLFKLKLSDPAELDQLLDAAAYRALLESEQG